MVAEMRSTLTFLVMILTRSSPTTLAPSRTVPFRRSVMRLEHREGTEELMSFLECVGLPFSSIVLKEFRFLPKPQAKYGYIDLDVPGGP